MRGRQTAWLLAGVIALLSSTRLLATRPPWTPDTTRMAVARAELVVRGTITSIAMESVPLHGKEHPSTVLQLKVSEVIKGTYNRPEVKVVLLGTAQAMTEGVTYDYRKGEDVILCLRFDQQALGGVYRFWTDAQSLVNRKGTWMTRHGGAFSIEMVRDAAGQKPAADKT